MTPRVTKTLPHPPPGPPSDRPVLRRRLRPKRQRVVLEVAYEGAAFHGFQRQPDRRTVEGELIRAVLDLGLSGGLGFASRTDTGVHASGQVIAFAAPAERPPTAWAEELSARLPPDVRIVRAASAPSRFHPRWSALGKRYVYRLETAREGERAPYFWDCVVDRLDMRLFERALSELRDAPSLEGFTAAGAPDRPAPPLTRVELTREAGDRVSVVIEGPAFRRYAIRHMMGCAVAQALGELPRGSCAAVARQPPPYRGPRAPASGLTLEKVFYPPQLDPFPG